jgi:pimeloyl-ACP methyl ester carboxylesterase
MFLFYGSDDMNATLAMGNYYAAHIPKSILKVYPHEGHLLFISHGEEILKTLTL